MRISKEHDERKNEILDTAERLFHEKGYERSTVNDILAEVGIAKGTFYYYFKSKEEVLDAIVERYGESITDRVSKMQGNDALTPREKLLNAFLSMRIREQVEKEVLDVLHKTENALLHQKMLNRMVTVMAPLLAQIVEEGIKKKAWNCKYPLQFMQIFLAASLTLTDEGVFEQNVGSQERLMAALISMLEKMLEVTENTFLKSFIEYGLNT